MKRHGQNPSPPATVHACERARTALGAGDPREAAGILDRWLRGHADDPVALHLRGVAAILLGSPAQSIECIEKAIRASPDNADYWCDLGNAQHAARDLPAAERAYLEALRLQPAHTDALFNLANAIREQKRSQEALQFYTLLLGIRPDHGNAWNNTGLALLDMGRIPEARQCFDRAIAIDPGNLSALLNLGVARHELGEIHAAVATYRQGIAAAPKRVDLRVNLARSLNALGRAPEAIAELNQALRLDPADANAHANLIFALDYDPAATTADQQTARRKWQRRCVQPLALKAADSYRNPDPDRRLRIGYVSADFRLTSAAMAFGPAIFDYDNDAFEVVCYSNAPLEDQLTARIREHVAAFRVIAGLNDDDAAALIASDAIDILVDLSGHMRGNRLGIFARRPAPIQGSAWGYAAGTGMPEIDFLVADPVFLTPADAELFAERPLYVPSVIPYRTFDSAPEVTPAPVTTRGALTFGCYSRLQKISDAAIGLWSAVLREIPSADLVLKSSQQTEMQALDDLLGKFVAAGIAADRVRVLPNAGWCEHMASFGEIDIQLDPFPHGGGISLLDGVMMGVPTLTLAGHTPAARLGAALLTALDLRDWIADTPEDYVRIAVDWSRRIGELQALRAGLRGPLLASPVGDGKRYMRAVEKALRERWQERCAAFAVERNTRLERARADIPFNRNLRQNLGAMESLVRADPRDHVAWHLAGLASFKLGDFALAARQLQTAVEANPEFLDAWIDLGTALTNASRENDAVCALRRAAEIDAGNWMIHYNLGVLYLGTARNREALEALNTAGGLAPDNPEVINNLAVATARHGRLPEAVELVRRAIALAPGLIAAHETLGRFCLEDDQGEEAVRHFEKALSLEPTGPVRHANYTLRFELAAWYDRLGLNNRMARLTPATFHETGVRRPRTFADAVSAIIRMLQAEAVANRKPPSWGEQQLIAGAGRMMEIEHPGKTELLERILELNPNNLDAHLNLGIAHYHDANYGAAKSAWGRGLERRDCIAAETGLADCAHRVLDTSWYHAVGHFQMLDAYFKSIELGWRPRRQLWLQRLPNIPVPNPALFEHMRRFVEAPEPDAGGGNLSAIEQGTGIPLSQLKLITDNFYADRRGDGEVTWHMEFAARVQEEWDAEQRPPLFRLTADEEAFGRETLRRLGVPDGAWYVCVHVREPGFWKGWDRYHQSIRNAQIETYFPAMRQIVARGGWVIRMGDPSMSKLPAMEGVIDYAHGNEKCARMDVFLWASCRFFIGVNSGPSLIPPTFGRPCLLTNFAPISIPFPGENDLMLPKLFRRRADDHILTLDEMVDCGVAEAQFAAGVPDGVDVVDNSAEEIILGVEEMLDRTGDRFREAHLSPLQRQYRAHTRARIGFFGSTISARWLECRRNWLPTALPSSIGEPPRLSFPSRLPL